MHFHEVDVQDILQIHVGRPGSKDFLAWNYTKSGLFSVKSAYHLAMQRKKQLRGSPESSRSCDEHKGWLSLWNSDVPGKVKVHLWRLIENGLAVGKELKHRRIKDGINCLVCGKEESLSHRFWSCSHSASAWFLLEEQTGIVMEKPPKILPCHSDLKGWLLDWVGKEKGKKVSWMMMLIYNLWLARNDAWDTNRIEDPAMIVKRTLAGVEEWMTIHDKPSNPVSRAPEHWLPPEEEFVKLNVDGAYRSASRNGGGGAVIRDCHGRFLAGTCHFFPHLADAEGSELLACKRGLQVAMECQIKKLVLETDSTEVAAKLAKDEIDRSAYGALISEIKELLRGFEATSVRAVRRSANDAAHRMAKEGCENNLCKVWFREPPNFIVNRLDLDSAMA